MVDTSAPRNEPNVPTGPARVDKTQYRPIRIIGLLLILQVIGLVGVGIYEFAQVDWEQDWEQVDPEAIPQEVFEAAAFIFYVPPAVLTLLAALGFLFLRRRGWLLAAISQGLSLGVSLWLYTELDPAYIYPIMVYCILMILYLNSHDVRVVFHPRRDPSEQSLEATRGS
jgi:hypothetical protein